MMKKGIDVSTHNGRIDWAAVKSSGIEFAILRAGYGREISQKDARFEEYYAGCKQYGIPCGVYWYNYATTVEDAKREAQACIEVIKGKQFEYPVYYDIEESATMNRGTATVSAIANAFCETLEKAGYYVGIYSMKSGLESRFNEEVKKAYTVWVAHVEVSSTSYAGAYDMWQYSWKGALSGISGDVDMNYCYKDFPALIKSSGHNGFSKAAEPATETAPAKSIDELAKEVLNGKWGNGEERKSALSKSGYDYVAIQARVNQLLSPSATDYTEYTVKKGDTLWEIAQKYLKNGSRYKEIMKASGVSSETIYPGQKLKIPKM